MTMRRMLAGRVWILAVAFAWLARCAGQAATYYVASTGNDAHPGTWAQPFRTLQKGADVARAGDTVQVRGGSYTDDVTVKYSGTGTPLSASTERSGTGTNPRACPTAQPVPACTWPAKTRATQRPRTRRHGTTW
ncbi:MAG: DUF1565 domain-containing protein [Kiritimatiellae bacterium]|nr:DUF1565 domain-containing protein [Kiritimatiellia bacterium]